MEKPIILLDMDEVLADFITEWLKRYNRDYQDRLTVEDLTDWNASLFTKPECGLRLYDYFKDAGIYRNLKPKEGSQWAVADLINRGAEIVIVTDSPMGCSFESADWKGSNPTDDKRAWLAEHFPMIPKENVIVTSQKWRVMGDVLVDDKPATIQSFQEKGRRVITMDMPYNQGVVAHIRATGWKEVHELLVQEFMPQRV